MKLTSYSEGDGEPVPGLVLDGRIVDLATAAGVWSMATGESVPPAAFTSVLSLLRQPDYVLSIAARIAAWVAGNEQDALTTPLEEVNLTLPIDRPGKIICIGLNYADHCREQGVEPPAAPVIFTKFTTALLPHGGAITWPPDLTAQVDFEAELAVVIGRRARSVSAAEAMACVAGYTIVNDVSARDLQFADGQWIRGKSLDTFCPIGPVIVTKDEIADPHNLAIQCRVNGVTLQDSNTTEMIFRIPALIETITAFCTLEPGDIICTGTPHGVGVFRDPRIFLQPGDVVEVEIEGIGVLRNPVA